MAAPFEIRPLPEQGFFGRMFGRVHRDAMMAEIETLLASRADWGTITRDDIAVLERKYGGTCRDNALNETILLFCRAADDMPAQTVVEGGAAKLRRLATALGVASQAETVVRSKARTALAEAAERVIADGVLDDGEREAYAAAAEACDIEDDEAQGILASAIAGRMKAEIAGAVADGKLTDAEEARIDAIGHGLNAQLDIDETMRATVAHARRLWQVEDGPLEAVTCPIALPSTEMCLYAGYGQALEPRTRGHQSFTHSYGAGDIVLTTKRIIFNGGAKNMAVRLNAVVDYRAYDDGVEVRKVTGKPLTFALNGKDEWFARLFARARRDAG